VKIGLFVFSVTVEAVGSIVATFALQTLGGLHVLAAAVVGAVVIGTILESLVEVSVQQGLGRLRPIVLPPVAPPEPSSGEPVAAPRPAPKPADSPPPRQPKPASSPRRRWSRVLGLWWLATVLTAIVVWVGGLTVLERLSGSAIVGPGDRSTTFFSPRDTTSPGTTGEPIARGNTITLGYSEELRPASTEGRDGFRLAKGPEKLHITAVAANGDEVVLTLSAEVAEGTELEVEYTAEVGFVRDTAGNRALAFGPTPVTELAQPPLLVAAGGEVGSRTITLVFDGGLAPFEGEDLRPYLVVTVDEAKAEPGSIESDGGRIRVTLSEPLGQNSKVEVAYTPGPDGVLRDDAGHEVEGFHKEVVITADETAPSVEEPLVYSGSENAVKVPFDEGLDESSPPEPDDFTVRVDGSETPLSATVSGNVVLLALQAAAVSADASFVVSYKGETLRDLAGNAVEPFTAELGEPVQPPAVSAATYNDVERVVVIEFDAALDGDSTPGVESFDIVAGARPGQPAKVSIDGPRVVLALDADLAAVLSAAFEGGETPRIAYRRPTDAPLQSQDEVPVADFESQPLTQSE
jgi:uncharacterized repeat protein (TIGR02059 family)